MKVEDRIKNLYNGEYELIGEYKGTSKPLTLKHKVCNTTYTRKKANPFLNEGEGLCPKCSIKNKKSRMNYSKLTEQDVSELIKEKNSDYEYVSGFKGSSTNKVIIKHIKCGMNSDKVLKTFLGKRNRG